jgi:hypothetical protein
VVAVAYDQQLHVCGCGHQGGPAGLRMTFMLHIDLPNRIRSPQPGGRHDERVPARPGLVTWPGTEAVSAVNAVSHALSTTSIQQRTA